MKALLLFVLILVLFVSFVDFTNGKVSTDNVSGRISGNFQFISDKTSEIFQNVSDKVSKPPDYELQITGARYLRDCVQKSIDKKESCLLVNLEIKNNYSESLVLEMKGKTIVTKDGKQLERYGGLFNVKELSGECDSSTYFKLFPNARESTGMCFPLVSKSDDPTMYLKFTANGKPNEHSFDLTPYIP